MPFAYAINDHTGPSAGPGRHTMAALLHASLADSPATMVPDLDVLVGALQQAYERRQAAGVSAACAGSIELQAKVDRIRAYQAGLVFSIYVA